MKKFLVFCYATACLFLTPLIANACDCDDPATGWYKNLPNQALAYAAQEFDKTAPAPGVDWKGGSADWFLAAASAGWLEKTDPLAAKPNALILLKNPTIGVTVGFIRDVTDKAVVYQSISPQGTVTQTTVPFEQLTRSQSLIGYIFPTKVDPAGQTRFTLP